MGAGHTKNTAGEIDVPLIDVLLSRDPGLKPYEREIRRRFNVFNQFLDRINSEEGGLDKFTTGYLQFGMLFNEDNSVTCREWAPGADRVYITGEFNDWQADAHEFKKLPYGKWEINIPPGKDGSCVIKHLSDIKLLIRTSSGELVERVSPWAKYVVPACEEGCIMYRQKVWHPEKKYDFMHCSPPKPVSLRIYESHIGISTSEPKIGSYKEFVWYIIPRIVELGYNAIQLMAIMEHAYYASFGYHVTSFYAVSSRFGTPDDFKFLIDSAHENGLYVLLDVVHSHASKNVLDGLNEFDGTTACYFHDGRKGEHPVWDSRLFNYSEVEVLRFLLSNLRWYMDEYRIDGFRFDGVTSMLYHSRGVGEAFTGEYSQYFGLNVDCEGLLYLMLANYMLHEFYPQVITVAEDVSGMPGCCRPVFEGGLGFDYRLGMAIPELWVKLVREVKDEDWSMGEIVHILTNRRYMEKTIAYVESHDQAIVGDKTLAFWLMDKDMYTHMSTLSEPSIIIDRGIALHKLIRLITHALGGEGYLNFMGNEFGHPEWLDFPREGNKQSYHYARRQWNLVRDDLLKYKFLNNFDRIMNKLDSYYHWLASDDVYVNLKHEYDKVIAFERGNLLFAFCFHPTKSFPDYPIPVRKHAVYKIILSSDDEIYGGYGRVDTTIEGQTIEDMNDGRRIKFLIYIPSRTALVFERKDLEEEEC